jgi:PAS domain S-box-containing protein
MLTVEDQLRAVFASAPLAIVALDRASVVTMWNPAAEAIFGYTAAESIGRSAARELLPYTARVLDGEAITNLDLTHTRKDGGAVNVRVSISPLCDVRGHTYGTVAIFSPR